MAAAVEHAHCNTHVNNVKITPEGTEMTAHIKTNEPWEDGPTIQIPAETDIKSSQGGGLEDGFFCDVYVDDSSW